MSRATNAAGSSSCRPSASTACSNSSNDKRSKRARIRFAIESLHERVLGIQLEARNRRGRLVAGGSQQLAHLIAEVVLVEHEARGRLPQSAADSNLVDALAQHLLHALQQRLAFAVVGLRLVLGAVGRGQVERSAPHVLARLALVLREVLHHPLVEPIRQQQHLDAALFERFQVRVVPRGRRRLGDEIVDRLLLRLGVAQSSP